MVQWKEILLRSVYLLQLLYSRIVTTVDLRNCVEVLRGDHPAWRRDSRREVTSTAWRLLSVKTAISIATTSVELRAGDWPSTKLLPPVSEVCFSSAWR